MFTDPLDQILPLIKKSFDPNDLIRELKETYTPRLWGKSLIPRKSFEGR
ncbi:MAG: hypothetical protein ACXWM7_04675 [Parachlamydiaceae bacterium]